MSQVLTSSPQVLSRSADGGILLQSHLVCLTANLTREMALITSVIIFKYKHSYW